MPTPAPEPALLDQLKAFYRDLLHMPLDDIEQLYSQDIVFGLFKRGGWVSTEIVPDARKRTLQRVIRSKVDLDSVIHFFESSMAPMNSPTLGPTSAASNHSGSMPNCD
ncbi:MAG: hypothetical protein GDA55_05435 [Cellvibrionales bacterium]|nr:hypothetical protein [Cellvibrionales bacterium]